jgi:hypothetical protein
MEMGDWNEERESTEISGEKERDKRKNEENVFDHTTRRTMQVRDLEQLHELRVFFRT